jgi:tetratricopeptide (TPR) repeat protein
LNFFITGDNPDAAAKKLEEAIASDPNSAEYRFNAGVMYDKLAVASKDKMKKNEYFDKSEAAYKKAIELDAKNTDYKFNLGALYFNKAKEIIDVMNKELDNKKYEAMKKDRDAQMALALPALEGVKTTLDAKGLGDERDKQTYKSTLEALKSVYAILGKLDKAKEVSSLLQKL